ncbi:type II 3-dehydroquinate dehydratase [Agromyces mangrovi Wang et al. 2018]|uniref:type II 3-dehydroquinate dehydratase n=1 Tax=Agromyces mangrovi TaxID=1858653 RepID=UPI002573D7FC|nr:type II 3-dehydroquinate dehydratase [Agromyces mangrovi]BDZ65359.1 3-dehydroquinate dehydratase [Agromyces mangrovi]
MKPPLHVLNGPNLNMLGVREPHLYGTTTLAEIEGECTRIADELDVDLRFRQSNAEHQLIEWVHEAYRTDAAVVLNPAGLSFRSVPLLDSVKILRTPVVELHLTNIHRRDDLHRHSIISSVVDAVIAGAGPFGYELAIRAAHRMLATDAVAHRPIPAR